MEEKLGKIGWWEGGVLALNTRCKELVIVSRLLSLHRGFGYRVAITRGKSTGKGEGREMEVREGAAVPFGAVIHWMGLSLLPLQLFVAPRSLMVPSQAHPM